MKTLSVPFVSQIKLGALAHNNDCGAACTLMVLRAYGLYTQTTVDKLYDEMLPYGDAALSASVMQNKLSQNQIKNKWVVDARIRDMYDTLSTKSPIIALIHYAPLVEAGLTEKTGFRGAHFVVVTGIDIENVCIRDPYTTRDDSFTEIPINLFDRCWAECLADGNPKYSGIFVTVPIQNMLETQPTGKPYQLNVNGINVRSGPSSNYYLVRTIWRSVEPTVRILEVSGEWGRIEDGWVYLAYLRPIL